MLKNELYYTSYIVDMFCAIDIACLSLLLRICNVMYSRVLDQDLLGSVTIGLSGSVYIFHGSVSDLCTVVSSL
jgi:hypothetical protein